MISPIPETATRSDFFLVCLASNTTTSKKTYDYVEKDITKGETRTPEFLAMNTNGRIPLLQLDNGECLPESNAILHYLADGTAYLPTDRLEHARVLQWMFFEQYSHEPAIAVARFIVHHLPADHPRQAELPQKREAGHTALAVMEDHLSGRDWFVGTAPSIADIALFAYTHVADQGGVMLDDYPAINAWLNNVRALQNFVTMAP